MKLGDLIRVRQVEWMDSPGFLLHIISEENHGGFGIIIMSGPHSGVEHTIYPSLDRREFEVISESR